MKLNEIKKLPKSKNAVLIEGLPGIGNVGKIASDYMVETLKAKKVAEISSNLFPNLVIVNEENMIEMPTISIWYKKIRNKDLFFVMGDFQPNTEEGSFQLTETIIGYVKKQGIKEIITLGGIGLESVSEDPKVYTTGNNKKTLEDYKKAGANPEVYGKVGTIVGVTGLLLGMTDKKIVASTLLAETTFEPGITAIISAKKLIEVIKKKHKINISLKELDDEFIEIENKNLKEVEKLENISKFEETNYIG